MTSTYAQGARPKETTYSSPSPSSSYSSIGRDGSRNHLSSSSTSQYSSLGGDSSSRPSARFSHGSPHLHPPQEPQRSYQTSAHISPSFPPRASRYATPPARADTALPPRPSPEGGESEGTRSTRRLLSRLFSRRSSQDSSSGSSVRSLDDDANKPAASDRGSRTSYVEASARSSEAPSGVLRNRRAERAPLQESYGSGASQAGFPSSCRQPGGGSSGGSRQGAAASSWLSSSLRERCSPLLSRLRRHARDEGQRPSGRWGNADRSSSQDDDRDDDEEEEEEEEREEGAVGLGVFGSGSSSRLEDDVRPDVHDEFSPRHRVGVRENVTFPRSLFGGVEKQTEEQKETEESSRDQEKLRKIKERYGVPFRF